MKAGVLRWPARVFVVALPAVLVFPAPMTQAVELHTERSLYRNIVVTEDDGVRCMKFGRSGGGRQTCQSVTDPDRMVFDYTKMMMAALYLNPSPQRILIIGLGGGTLPRALQKLFPGSKIDAVEIDPAVVRVAGKYFSFVPGPRTEVFEEDGRVFAKRMAKQGVRYDLVMLDAFDHEYIPEHLLTREFLVEIKGLLAPGGVLAANTFAGSKLYDFESATYFSVFGQFYRLKRGNRVILIRQNGLPDREELNRNADALEAKLAPFGADKDWLLPMFGIESGWPRNTRLLTDQYSPSNLLNGS
jgi:spermidine synthase